MNKEKYIELIHAEIDGTISKEEKIDLDRFLASDPEMRRVYVELTGVNEILNQSGRLEPPPDMKKKIMQSIRVDKYASRKKIGLISRLLENLRVKVSPKYVISYSAGLATGLIIVLLLVIGPGNLKNISIDRLTGTIVSPGIPSEFAKIDELKINISDIVGKVSVYGDENALQLIIDLQSENEYEFVADFEPDIIFLQTFTAQAPGSEILEANHGAIRIFHKGVNEYSFLFKSRRDLESQIIFKIYSDTLIYEGETFLNFKK